MPNTYSYMPQNLILARKVDVGYHNKIQSLVWRAVWPKDGYMQAECYRQLPSIFYPSLPHDNKYCDVCGIYGNFDLAILFRGQVTILIETHGKVVIGNRLIARTQAAQVIAIVGIKNLPLSAFPTLPKTTTLAYENFKIEIANANFAQQYFDVPLLTPNEAQLLIDQQAAVWGLSEMITDIRKKEEEKRYTGERLALNIHIDPQHLHKALKFAAVSMVDFKAAITNIDPSIDPNITNND